ncbi:MAG: hypothetical protein GXP62_21065 [Oligoflexia bacterium]|nr:hypothetical protein [Oligoflexia bacterium]
MTATLEAGREETAKQVSVPALLPAQLAPFAARDQVRTRYPLVLLPPGADAAARTAVPIADFLPELAAATGADSAPLVVDNLVRLESWVRAQVRDADRPLDAVKALRLAAQAMLASLKLAAEPSASLRAQLDAMTAAVPAGSRLLPYLPGAELWLLLQVATPARQAARQAWRDRLRATRSALADLAQVERAKDPQAVSPAGLSDTVGKLADSFMDAQALAAVVGPARGGLRMAPARLEHLGRLLVVLDRALAAPAQPVMVVVGAQLRADGVSCVAGQPKGNSEGGSACAQAATQFDRLAAAQIDVVAAVRAARLEIDGVYDSAQHDAKVAGLDWWHLTADELAVLPVVVAVERADAVVRDGMAELTRLVGSGRPVQVLVDVQATRNPGATDGPLSGFRVELGRLGMGLGQALVQQTTPALPDHLLEGLRRALGGGRAGLHLLCSGYLDDGGQPTPGAWLTASSAVESRAHPLYCYDPDAGVSWADCLDAAANPQPEVDWVDDPVGDGDAVYTFAHHAVLDPALLGHFRLPSQAELDSGRLLPIDQWLDLEPAAASTLSPTLRVVDQGQVQVRVVSEAVAFACRDRLRGWRALREQAGFQNEHARRAAEQARAEALAEAQVARDALVAAHDAELEQVRTDAAAQALGRLAAALVDADWTGALPAAGAVVPSGSIGSGASSRAEVEPQAPDAAAELDADAASDALVAQTEPEEVEDAWIDSPLCTSCNDCLDVNRQLFIYDGNKQALIGDPTAGTFEELVRAAEGCPARCIHPGSPLNQGEPGLDDLVARAARFN